MPKIKIDSFIYQKAASKKPLGDTLYHSLASNLIANDHFLSIKPGQMTHAWFDGTNCYLKSCGRFMSIHVDCLCWKCLTAVEVEFVQSLTALVDSKRRGSNIIAAHDFWHDPKDVTEAVATEDIHPISRWTPYCWVTVTCCWRTTRWQLLPLIRLENSGRAPIQTSLQPPPMPCNHRNANLRQSL